jgi:hypothetical protein
MITSIEDIAGMPGISRDFRSEGADLRIDDFESWQASLLKSWRAASSPRLTGFQLFINS